MRLLFRNLPWPRALYTLLFVATFLSACSRPNAPAEVHPSSTAPAVQAIPGFPPTEADIRFMRDMIPHHEQALVMAGWAPSHDAGADIQRLSERLIVSQRDEIALARDVLRSAGVHVPEADSAHAAMVHGMDHGALMPGMLTHDEMSRLDAARGEEFDRLFLEYMIRHHLGAVLMVDRLFTTPGAAQNERVFQFANDVFADQTAEIDRMKRMLEAMAAQQ